MTQIIHDAIKIGIPTTAILDGFLFQNRRFERVDKAALKLYAKFNALNLEGAIGPSM